VRVVEGVVHHPSGTPVAKDARRAQQPQGMRHRRFGGVDHRGDVAHAEFTGFDERVQDLDAGGVTEQTEEVGQVPDLFAADLSLLGCSDALVVDDPHRATVGLEGGDGVGHPASLPGRGHLARVIPTGGWWVSVGGLR